MSFQQNTVVPYQPTSQNVTNTQVQVINTGAMVTQPEPQYINTTSHIIFACFVFWCCNWPCGLIAFICAMLASSAASEGDYERARSCAHTSNGFSVAGIITTVVLIIVLYFSILRY